MTNAISNMDDVIDSRDIIERIEELETQIEENAEEVSEDEKEELRILKALAEECEGYSDWKYGESLIRDSYFEDYAQELAEDCGMIERDVKWPYTCIDWEKAARELQYDYSCVNFDGVDYWIRS